MSSTICVVDVPAFRYNADATLSRTLPSRKFAGASLLSWVAQRLTDVETVDRIVILLSDAHSELAELSPPGVSSYVSSRPDALGRFADLCHASNATAVVRVAIDTPFVDPSLIDQLVCAGSQSNCDYATYCCHDGTSAIQSQLGVVAEWMTAQSIYKADRATGDIRLREQPARCIWSRPEDYQLKFIALPAPLDRDNLRLVVTNEEEWENAHQIYEALGPDDLDWQQIAVLFPEQSQAAQAVIVND